MKLHKEDLEKIELLRELSPGCYKNYKNLLNDRSYNIPLKIKKN
tara:strand:+ start:1735 stop:1866 length:132 start_codon:yes stop_codon:yes gene_type:complete